MSKKIPCGGFELDDSLEVRDGKLGLAGGTGGIRTAIIKSSLYDKVLAGEDVEPSEETYECINMTLDEARVAMHSGKPFSIIMMGCMNSNRVCIEDVPFQFTSLNSFIFKNTMMNSTYEWDNYGIREQSSPE